MTPQRIVPLVLGVSTLLGLAWFAHAATELARINTTVISLEDFNKKYRDNLKFFQFKTPTKKNVLDDMVKRELAIQEARKLGLDKDPDVQERMNTVLYHALIDKKLTKDFENIKISDDEAQSYYSKNPEIRTSHIFISLKPDAAPDQVKKAQEKIRKIQSDYLKDGKMSFAEVAQRYSEGIASPMGGDIDYQTRDKLDPAYYEAALALKSPGKVSDVVRSQFGFHLIKLTAIRPWDETDKGQVKRLLFDDKRNQIFDRYIGDLRKTAKVQTHPELLKD